GTGNGVWRRLKTFGFWRSLILLFSAVPIAILTNALRVSGTGVLAHYYGTGVADGFFHSFSGWVIYVSAALLLFAVAWLVDRFEPGSKDTAGRNLSREQSLEGTVSGSRKANAAAVIQTEEAK